jgi:hypothetical protein
VNQGEEDGTGGLRKLHNAELHNLEGLLLAKSDLELPNKDKYV